MLMSEIRRFLLSRALGSLKVEFLGAILIISQLDLVTDILMLFEFLKVEFYKAFGTSIGCLVGELLFLCMHHSTTHVCCTPHRHAPLFEVCAE